MAKTARSPKRPVTPPEPPGRPVAPRPGGQAAKVDPTSILLRALLIAGASLWIYGPSFHGQWLWDDSLYITDNPLLRDPAAWWKIWFVPGSFMEYYPITQSLQWTQWHFLGDDTLGYHLANVFLHILNALLLWRLFSKLGLQWGWLGGLVLTVHPLSVESVAWISELKNELSLAPLLLAMGAWIDYENDRRSRNYLLAIGWFVIAMLCKNSTALFPFVILLYAFCQRGRLGASDLKASVPFFGVAFVFGAISVWAGTVYAHDHVTPPDAISSADVWARPALAALVIPVSLLKFIWPVGLMPVYREWSLDLSSVPEWILLFAFVALLVKAWQAQRDWGRHVLLGLGFFLINLVPLQVSMLIRYRTMVWSLDHLVYLSMIALIGLTIAGLELIAARTSGPAKKGLLGLAAAVLLLLAVQSHSYAKSFADKDALWSYTLKTDPTNWQAHEYMGQFLQDSGRLSEAIDEFEAAMLLRGDSSDTHYNLACALAQANRLLEALDQFQQAVQLNPRAYQAYDDWGAALIQEGKTAEAMALFQKASAINPSFAQAHNDMGNALLGQGRFEEASQEYKKAIQIDPTVAIVHTNLGLALSKLGRTAEAQDQFKTALALDPNDATARQNLEPGTK